MYFESRLQKYCRIGRVASLLTGRAALKGSPAFFTQMLRVPLNGFRNDRYCPSGEICAPAIWISPKNAARSIIGGCCAPSPRQVSKHDAASAAKTVLLITSSVPCRLPLRPGIEKQLVTGERSGFKLRRDRD